MNFLAPVILFHPALNLPRGSYHFQAIDIVLHCGYFSPKKRGLGNFSVQQDLILAHFFLCASWLSWWSADANIQGDANPEGAGAWELPGFGHLEPAIGKRTIIED